MAVENFIWKCLSLCTFLIAVHVVISSRNKVQYVEMRGSDNQSGQPPNRKSTIQRLGEILKCGDNDFRYERLMNGDYWLLKNYIRAGHGPLKCFESITYTTHGDYTFLDNLVPLVTRWKAPISISLHAPGFDFDRTLDSIKYLQKCLPESHLVKQFVTFHIYFHLSHLPRYVPQSETEIWATDIACENSAPYLKVNQSEMYKHKKKLLYPINVGRNIARKAALTHFVFASDVELYPTPGLVEQFFKMIVKKKSLLRGKTRKVFPLAVFEISSDSSIPNTKTQLQRLIAAKKAIPFHQHLCQTCHAIPNQTEWIRSPETDQLRVFSVAKRSGLYESWEPFYIGTNADPIFDERVHWEGQKNKMVQCYVLCLLDYDFNVLNNAFLIHSPGFKKGVRDPERLPHIIRTNNMIVSKFIPEYNALYGARKKCKINIDL